MAKLGEVGQSQRRQVSPAAAPAGSESCKIAVGKREHHKLSRILAEVPWDRSLFETAALAKDNVHHIPSPALIATSSISPCSPITTSFECRGCAPHGVSY